MRELPRPPCGGFICHGLARALGPFGGRAAMAEPRPLGNGACASEPFINLMLRRPQVIFITCKLMKRIKNACTRYKNVPAKLGGRKSRRR